MENNRKRTIIEKFLLIVVTVAIAWIIYHLYSCSKTAEYYMVLRGDEIISIQLNEEFVVDPGVIFLDEDNNEVSAEKQDKLLKEVTITGRDEVNTSISGEYQISYEYKDQVINRLVKVLEDKEGNDTDVEESDNDVESNEATTEDDQLTDNSGKKDKNADKKDKKDKSDDNGIKSKDSAGDKQLTGYNGKKDKNADKKDKKDKSDDNGIKSKDSAGDKQLTGNNGKKDKDADKKDNKKDKSDDTAKKDTDRNNESSDNDKDTSDASDDNPKDTETEKLLVYKLPAYVKFDSLEVTYSGRKYTISVNTVPKGLVARYSNCTRTAAGSQVGKVTFGLTEELAGKYSCVEPSFLTATLTIDKAVPSYKVPEKLEAKVGQKLKDVALPEGFKFEDNLDTEVGNIGQHTFKATYTPADTENYEIVTGIEVVVEVYGSSFQQLRVDT